MDIRDILGEYQSLFSEKPDLLGNYFGPHGCPNRAFFYKLFGEVATCEDIFWDFLDDCSLIPSKMKCDRCGGDMSRIVCKGANLDGRVWYCGGGGRSNRCRGKKSVRHSSYFTGSHLRISTILFMPTNCF